MISLDRILANINATNKTDIPDSPLEKSCAICGKSFQPKRKNQICCSPECAAKKECERQKARREKRRAARVTEKNCVVCGKSFQSTRITHKYCSHKCWAKHRSQQNNECQKAQRAANRVEKICPTCGKSFMPSTGQQKYCSRECLHLQFSATSKKAAEKVREELKDTVRNCPVCGEDFTPTCKSQKYCSIDCRKKSYRAAKIKTRRVKCAFCGTEFFTEHDSDEIFCCESCRNQYNAQAEKPVLPTQRKKHSDKSVADWQKEALLCGMTYGQYRAAVEKLGKTFDELKLPDPPPADDQIIFERKI